MEDSLREELAVLKDKKLSLTRRLAASERVWRAVLRNEVRDDDMSYAYNVMVQAWKSLGAWASDRLDRNLILPRKRLAANCERVSRRLQEGQKFFRDFPRVGLAEGPCDDKRGRTITGAVKACVYTSIYEFHLEYPIEGMGVRKDRISVVTGPGARLPLFEWCEIHGVIVYCGRCGLDITFEVSRLCPWRKF